MIKGNVFIFMSILVEGVPLFLFPPRSLFYSPSPPPCTVETSPLAALVILCTTAQHHPRPPTTPSTAWTCTPSRRWSLTVAPIASEWTASISLCRGRMWLGTRQWMTRLGGSMSLRAIPQKMCCSLKFSCHLSMINRWESISRRVNHVHPIIIMIWPLFQFYVVMATHEMGAFIHVYDGKSKLSTTSGIA